MQAHRSAGAADGRMKCNRGSTGGRGAEQLMGHVEHHADAAVLGLCRCLRGVRRKRCL